LKKKTRGLKQQKVFVNLIETEVDKKIVVMIHRNEHFATILPSSLGITGRGSFVTTFNIIPARWTTTRGAWTDGAKMESRRRRVSGDSSPWAPCVSVLAQFPSSPVHPTIVHFTVSLPIGKLRRFRKALSINVLRNSKLNGQGK
jgi:hypothetical protein